MGKKDKSKKKGMGAEKTAMKTDKKLIAKQKKMIAKLGEDDIEAVVAKYESKITKSSDIVETLCAPPSARVNFAICSHPDKEEIFLHGGELFNGQKTVVFGEFYCYNVPKNDWRVMNSSICPAPRSGHQMISISADGGQLWLFGGEYASPSQLQFYHFKDLWVYRISQRQWEKIGAPNGPSARSGHRMTYAKKKLYVFGGFHDNNTSYRYFNDLYTFSLETYTWTKVETAGSPPAPRSGCCLISHTDGKILIWGGYSKSAVKKEIDRGNTFSDMFSLTPEKNDDKLYRWTQLKPGGKKPPARSGTSVAVAPNGKIFTFGGVMDTAEDEEDVQGLFSNELYMLEIASYMWRKLDICNKRNKTKTHDVVMENVTESEKTVVYDDGVFTTSIGGGSSKIAHKKEETVSLDSNVPTPRMNAGLVICKGHLYLFGGLYESGNRQYTLSDLYSLDIHKLDNWKTIIANSAANNEWLGSDSESSGDDDTSDGDDDENSEEDSDSDSSDMDTD